MKTIAIVAGGNSSEYKVSLKSANGLISFIPDEYEKYIVTIVGNKWEVLDHNKSISIDRSDFSFVKDGKKIKFDFAYITIHGTPGENGILQGYFQMIGLSYSGCDVLASALTFNKFMFNNFIKSFGINVAKSIVLKDKQMKVDSKKLIDDLGLPMFVKPSVGGSSFGTTKVKCEDEVQKAIDNAFAEAEEVIIESFVDGTEVTCGMYRTTNKEVVFPITEVVSKNDFFDYNAKYHGESDEITPARISDQLTDRIQQLTVKIYDIIGARGITRADYIIDKTENIVLLEVNTTPGMTPQSFIPQQIRAANLDISSVMRDIIENR